VTTAGASGTASGGEDGPEVLRCPLVAIGAVLESAAEKGTIFSKAKPLKLLDKIMFLLNLGREAALATDEAGWHVAPARSACNAGHADARNRHGTGRIGLGTFWVRNVYGKKPYGYGKKPYRRIFAFMDVGINSSVWTWFGL
jgi:hypothetical protein